MFDCQSECLHTLSCIKLRRCVILCKQWIEINGNSKAA
jgi:hypothetical protein